METPSKRRLAENEVLFRQLNEQIQQGFDETNRLAKEDNQPEYKISHGPDDRPLHFFCECSDENCRQRVLVNHHEYNKIHKRRDHFVIIPGHEHETIEHVVRREKEFYVIEKLSPPPKKAKKLNPTAIDNTK